MPVLKNKTQGNYVNVYKGIAMDHSLSLKNRGMLLTLLSLPDNWDFTVAGLGKILPDGKTAIHSSLDSLQNAGYLTKQQTRGESGMFAENIIEVHETPCKPFSENRVTDNPTTRKPISEKQVQVNNKKAINKKVTTQELKNQSINQNLRMDMIDVYTDIVKENIAYEYIIIDNPHKKEMIDEILNLITETIVVAKETVRIAGIEYPYELVRGNFLKLNMGHIQYVLDCMDKNVTKIRNIKKLSINNIV